MHGKDMWNGGAALYALIPCDAELALVFILQPVYIQNAYPKLARSCCFDIGNFWSTASNAP